MGARAVRDHTLTKSLGVGRQGKGKSRADEMDTSGNERRSRSRDMRLMAINLRELYYGFVYGNCGKIRRQTSGKHATEGIYAK